MKITAWKFGKDDLTVKYETADGAYTLKTMDEPARTLYSAAADVVDKAKSALGFDFDVSFSAISVNYGGKPSAAIVLDAKTSILKFAEVKCPKIDRRRHLDKDAETRTLSGMDANAIPLVYNRFVNLNLAIDVFLKEAEAFVLSRPKREPTLFDELDISEREGEDGEDMAALYRGRR
jgi:hypothetical protein